MGIVKNLIVIIAVGELKKMNNEVKYTGGIGFCGLLTIVFIVLKLIGIIDWSWIWVFAPLWIDFIIALFIIVIFIIFCKMKERDLKWR